MEQFDDQQNFNHQLDTCKRSTQFRNSSSHFSNPKLCNFYSNYGFCKFGQNCKFLHRRKYFYSNKPTQKKPMSPDASLQIPREIAKNVNADSSGGCNSNGTMIHKTHSKQTCRYFKAGHCEKGESCFYSHNLDSYNFKIDVRVSKYRNDHVANSVNVVASKKKSIPVCQYFKRGSCLKGDQCKYYHNPKFQRQNFNISSNNNENLSDFQINGDKDTFCQKNEYDTVIASQSDDVIDQRNTENETVISSQSDNIISETAENPSSFEILTEPEISETFQQLKDLKSSDDAIINNHIKIGVQIPQNARNFNLTMLSEDGLFQLRNTEITQLRKRFPKLNESGTSFTFNFEPTDPDWPFDIKSVHLQVIFPESYPLEVCDISVVSHMNYMPGILLRHLNKSISDWLVEKHNAAIEQNQVILLFRPFLKWFDKNLEHIFNFCLKKETKDYGVHKANSDEPNQSEIDSPLSFENNPDNELSEQESSLPSNNPSTEADSEKETNVSPPRQKVEPTALNSSQMQGSKIIFTGLELIEGVAALSCKKLATTVHCGRCKTSCNKILIPNKNTPMVCSKCSRSMECNFNPSILHQFSSVLGTIYLIECQAVDINLVECAFLVDCLSCSKQVSVDGLHYGQKQKLWCKFCNQKLLIGIESVKFQASAATTVTTSSKTVAAKKVTKKKDPIIKEGCPLPDYGACKHYKKSYRWFPCCGRLYPCDLCHDEKEEDHDMKYASRMVCGFCSKEQPYSKEKPCFGCSSNMTKKSGSYWEGGQGCRNSATMSRKDGHKYAGMSKTTSKKSQPTGKKKK